MSYFGKNIRKIRKIKKLSQAALAELFGLTRASIGAYEEGRAEPKIDTIIDIAKYFNVKVDDIIGKELTVNELYQFDIFKEENIHPAIRKNNNPTFQTKPATLFLEDQLRTEQVAQLNWSDFSKNSQLELPANMVKGSFLIEVGQYMASKLPYLTVGEWLSFDPIQDAKMLKDQLIRKEILVIKKDDWQIGIVSKVTSSSISLSQPDQGANEIVVSIAEITLLLEVHSILNINSLFQKSIHSRLDSFENQLNELKKRVK